MLSTRISNIIFFCGVKVQVVLNSVYWIPSTRFYGMWERNTGGPVNDPYSKTNEATSVKQETEMVFNIHRE